MAIPKEQRLIHPKMVWILELPWVFAVFQLPDYAILLNFAVQGFISVAILASFKKHLETKGQSVGVLGYFGASCVSLVQGCAFLVSLAVIFWPAISPDHKPRWLSDLVNPIGWSLLVLAMYPLFLFTMYRLKERVLAIDKAERKDRSAKEIRSDLSKSVKKAKEGPTPLLTLVLEFNCNSAGGTMASVWLLPGKRAQEIGETEADIGTLSGAEKVLGPVTTDQAQAAFAALQSVLTRANIPFESRDAADD